MTPDPDRKHILNILSVWVFFYFAAMAWTKFTMLSVVIVTFQAWLVSYGYCETSTSMEIHFLSLQAKFYPNYTIGHILLLSGTSIHTHSLGVIYPGFEIFFCHYTDTMDVNGI